MNSKAVHEWRLQELRQIAEQELGRASLDPTAVSSVWAILGRLYELPWAAETLDWTHISLIYDAELQIEWAIDDQLLEVECRKDGQFRWLLRSPDQTETGVTGDPGAIRGLFERAWAPVSGASVVSAVG